MNYSVLKNLPAALSLVLVACDSGGASSSTTGAAVAAAAPVGSDDSDTIVLRAASDGAKTTIVIPDEPAGKANDPDGVYQTITPMAFSLEDQGFKDLVDSTVHGSVSDIFQGIMAKAVAGDGLSGLADGGALVMTVWYKRKHPDLGLHDIAVILDKDLPDVEKFKTAIITASNMLTDLGQNAPQGAVTRDAPSNVLRVAPDANAPTRAVRAPDTSGCPESPTDHARRMKLLEESNAGKRKLTEAEYEDAMTIPCLVDDAGAVDNAQ